MHKLKRVRQLEYVHKQNNESYIIYVSKVSSLIKKLKWKHEICKGNKVIDNLTVVS